MTSEKTNITEEPLWFGAPDRPVFGFLTRPSAGPLRGAVIIAPPVGYEARNAKRSLRELCRTLAQSGFATLRFDYRGTGDSSGAFGSSMPTPNWIDDILSGAQFLREAGFDVICLVGMRLGATMAAHAAWSTATPFQSVVFWDPCESGRRYLRENRALESLRREHFSDRDDGSIETTEYLFSAEMVASLRELTMEPPDECGRSTRFLVITRETQSLSTSTMAKFAALNTSFRKTTEQEDLLQSLPYYARVPFETIFHIVQWLEEGAVPRDIRVHPVITPEASLPVGSSGKVIERAEFLGLRRNFAVLTEPVSSPRGPWIVMLPNVHEDHNGPSRMWVDLARHWALSGIRSVRFDPSGIGDSPRTSNEEALTSLDGQWITEVVDACAALSPSTPDNVVLIGMCSGATLAIEAARRLRSRGLCALNPPIGINVLHSLSQMQTSRSSVLLFLGRRLRSVYASHPWIVTTVWEAIRLMRPRRWCRDIIAKIQGRGTKVLVLRSVDEFSEFSSIPLMRSLDGRHRDASLPYPSVIVEGLDHGFTIDDGRRRAAEQISDFVLSHFASGTVAPSPRN